MKRLTIIFSILLSLIVFTNCENANVTNLKKEVKVANASCPQNSGMAGDLLSVKYQEKENRVILYYSVNEELSRGLFIKSNKEKLLKQFRLTLSTSESQQMLKDIVNAEASLMLVFKSPSTGKTIKFELPYEELKEIKNNPLSKTEIYKMILENSVDVQNSSMPMKVDEGMVQTKVTIVDDNLVYYYELDENLYDIKTMKKMPVELKDGIREDLKNLRRDPSVQRDLQMLNALGMGFIYRYYGNNSKDYVDVLFTPEELADFMR